MTSQTMLSFIRAKRFSELERTGQKTLFCVWNALLLLLSSAGITVITLMLAIGMFDIEFFYDYFRYPLVFFLNFLPIFMFQLLMYCIFGRQWLAFAVSCAVFITAAVGDFFMLKLRYAPFSFEDVTMIGTGLAVAGTYDLTPNARIILAAAAAVFGTAFLIFFGRGRMSGRTRLILALAVAAAVFPLWKFVYSSSDYYNGKTANYDHAFAHNWAATTYAQKGFVYPFIYSISQSAGLAPDGYSDSVAQELLSGYVSADIPEDRRVNILAFQLESFSDLRTLGLSGISNETYAVYDELLAESYSGILCTDVAAGGTIVSEHSFITGDTTYVEPKRNYPSYARYLKSQGYSTVGSHPHTETYYGRSGTSKYLGFDDYRFAENYFDGMIDEADPYFCDDVFFPAAVSQFKELISGGENVFSFNVSLQGHGPYKTDRYSGTKEFWSMDGCSPETYNIVNNYLNAVYSTQQQIRAALDELSAAEEPVVAVFYGDHKPSLNSGRTAGETELGIYNIPDTYEGYLNHYSTRYFIWANDAAKEMLGSSFCGEGPMISPCYLMTLVFGQLGWTGDVRTQFMRSLMADYPVINSKDGYYLINGSFVSDLPEDAAAAVQSQKIVQYYLSRSFSS